VLACFAFTAARTQAPRTGAAASTAQASQIGVRFWIECLHKAKRCLKSARPTWIPGGPQQESSPTTAGLESHYPDTEDRPRRFPPDQLSSGKQSVDSLALEHRHQQKLLRQRTQPRPPDAGAGQTPRSIAAHRGPPPVTGIGQPWLTDSGPLSEPRRGEFGPRPDGWRWPAGTPGLPGVRGAARGVCPAPASRTSDTNRPHEPAPHTGAKREQPLSAPVPNSPPPPPPPAAAPPDRAPQPSAAAIRPSPDPAQVQALQAPAHRAPA